MLFGPALFAVHGKTGVVAVRQRGGVGRPVEKNVCFGGLCRVLAERVVVLLVPDTSRFHEGVDVCLINPHVRISAGW